MPEAHEDEIPVLVRGLRSFDRPAVPRPHPDATRLAHRASGRPPLR
jgi:hypothetical protein